MIEHVLGTEMVASLEALLPAAQVEFVPASPHLIPQSVTQPGTTS